MFMADLNELEKLTNELRLTHMNPTQTSTTQTSTTQYITKMAVREHGQPYKPKDGITATFMAVREHGQPYKPNDNDGVMATYMAVREHGQPYLNVSDGTYGKFNTDDMLPQLSGKK